MLISSFSSYHLRGNAFFLLWKERNFCMTFMCKVAHVWIRSEVGALRVLTAVENFAYQGRRNAGALISHKTRSVS